MGGGKNLTSKKPVEFNLDVLQLYFFFTVTVDNFLDRLALAILLHLSLPAVLNWQQGSSPKYTAPLS